MSSVIIISQNLFQELVTDEAVIGKVENDQTYPCTAVDGQLAFIEFEIRHCGCWYLSMLAQLVWIDGGAYSTASHEWVISDLDSVDSAEPNHMHILQLLHSHRAYTRRFCEQKRAVN